MNFFTIWPYIMNCRCILLRTDFPAREKHVFLYRHVEEVFY